MYDKVVRLHDPLRLLVEGWALQGIAAREIPGGKYIPNPNRLKQHTILEKFTDAQLEIYPRVKDYLSFRVSIHFDIKRAL